MGHQDAIQDRNKVRAQIIHSGTAGTAETIRRTGQTSGAANTHITGGTVNVDLVVGDLVNVQDQPYALRVDDANSGTVFVGESDIPGTTSAANWRIKRIVDNNGTVDIKWAGSASNFDQIWDNRGTLGYA